MLALACILVGVPSTGDITSESETSVEVEFDQGLLSVNARDAPLAHILHAIGKAAGFETDIQGNLDTAYTISFAGAPLPQARRQLTGDLSTVIAYHTADSEGHRRIAKVGVYLSSSDVKVVEASKAEPTIEVLRLSHQWRKRIGGRALEQYGNWRSLMTVSRNLRACSRRNQTLLFGLMQLLNLVRIGANLRLTF